MFDLIKEEVNMSILKEFGAFITGRGGEWPELEAIAAHKRCEQKLQEEEERERTRKQKAEEQRAEAARQAQIRKEEEERRIARVRLEREAGKWRKFVKKNLIRVVKETKKDGRMERFSIRFREAVWSSGVEWEIGALKKVRTGRYDSWDPLDKALYREEPGLCLQGQGYSVKLHFSKGDWYFKVSGVNGRVVATEQALKEALVEAYDKGPTFMSWTLKEPKDNRPPPHDSGH